MLEESMMLEKNDIWDLVEADLDIYDEQIYSRVMKEISDVEARIKNSEDATLRMVGEKIEVFWKMQSLVGELADRMEEVMDDLLMQNYEGM